jgi:hypothetical protein
VKRQGLFAQIGRLLARAVRDRPATIGAIFLRGR